MDMLNADKLVRTPLPGDKQHPLPSVPSTCNFDQQQPEVYTSTEMNMLKNKLISIDRGSILSSEPRSANYK